MAARGFLGAKSSIMFFLAGCMDLWAHLHNLRWSILHGLNLTLKNSGKFQTVPSVSILHVILLCYRYFFWFSLKKSCWILFASRNFYLCLVSAGEFTPTLAYNKLLSAQALPLERPTRTPIIISVAQFRPEKVGPFI